MSEITCIVADDHDIVLDGLVHALEDVVMIVARVSTGDDAVTQTLALEPDVLLLDVRMPGPGVEGVLAAVLRAECVTRVVIFSSLTTSERVRAAFEHGAAGYISKDAPTSTIADAIHTVVGGRRFLDPLLAADVIGDAPTSLSGRELAVLRLMAAGAQNDTIAHELGIASETVKSHTSNILRKFGATSRTGAVAHALRAGIVD